MSQIVNIDSDGVQHVVWLQQKDDTCGPACIYMVECERKRQSVIGGEVRIKQITSRMPNGYIEGSGTQAISALAHTLKAIGIPANNKYKNSMSDYLNGAKFPFIAHIAWVGGGGHFAVAVKKTSSNNIVFLDPFYALVEKPSSNDYTMKSGVLQSGVAARGVLSGHIVEIS